MKTRQDLTTIDLGLVVVLLRASAVVETRRVGVGKVVAWVCLSCVIVGF